MKKDLFSKETNFNVNIERKKKYPQIQATF